MKKHRNATGDHSAWLKNHFPIRVHGRNPAYDKALYHNIFTQAPIGIAIVRGEKFFQEMIFLFFETSLI